jgi:hypothetical protein
MTEDEARKMWCPFVRVADSLDATPPAANCTAGPDADRTPDWASCVGSLCMAWRWKKFDSARFMSADGEYVGYCGLAGKND